MEKANLNGSPCVITCNGNGKEGKEKAKGNDSKNLHQWLHLPFVETRPCLQNLNFGDIRNPFVDRCYHDSRPHATNFGHFFRSYIMSVLSEMSASSASDSDNSDMSDMHYMSDLCCMPPMSDLLRLWYVSRFGHIVRYWQYVRYGPLCPIRSHMGRIPDM